MQSKGLSIVFSITTVEKQQFFGTSFPGGSYGKESACNGGDQVQSLGWEDPLEKGMATHSSVLAWRIPWAEEPGRLQSMGSQRLGHFQLTLTSIHDYWKNHNFDYMDCKVMSLLFNMLSRFVILFLPTSKRLLISWLQSLSAVILEPPKNKVSHCFHYFPIYCP